MTSHEWLITDMIEKGLVSYVKGEKVVLFRRKSNGYPKGIKDGIEYTIRGIYGEGIEVALNSSNGIGWLQSIKVHRSYMIPKYALRDINLKKLLNS
jgi:6-phosphogluconate dehydrogenase (decarboxylating)